MRLFLVKIFTRLIVSLIGLMLYIILFTNFNKNKYDPYYVKLLGKTDRGLIIGDSRALQGINPELLSFPIFNFAFTIGHSPFDDSYIKLIKKKVDTISNIKRHHIISITPWSLLFPEKTDEDVNPYFSENLKFQLSNPNWEYIIKYWDLSFVNTLKFLHNKGYTSNLGWNNQNIDSNQLYSEYSRRVREKIHNYKSKYKKQNLTIQSHRVQNLINIIKFLKETGNVTVIRLPVSREMLELEKQMFPNFISLCDELAIQCNGKFIDLTDLNVQTTDGNHIWGKEVPKVMHELNMRINQFM
jgi:hypothetical protein